MRSILFRTLQLALLAAPALPASAQQTPPQGGAPRPRPEETEVWAPVPPVVTPGPAVSIAPPSDAIILFDGRNLDEWVNTRDKSPAGWTVANGLMTVNKQVGNIETKRRFRNYQLHLEWRVPEGTTQTGQSRGNSGLFLASTGPGDAGYELQILDSYGNNTYVNGQAASIYKQSAPLVNASRKQGEWQSYDVVWTAPTFNADGTLRTPAYVTAFHNGVLVQNNFPLRGETVYIGPPSYKPYQSAPIKLQSHGDPSPPISFRNIWIRELPAAAAAGGATAPRPQAQAAPERINPSLPTLFYIGDSTVRNGSGMGGNGEWGWGDRTAPYFDPGKINVVNRALGGRSSRTFLTQGHWDRVLQSLKRGDFVVMQFGHNDGGALNDTSRARGTIRGIGEEKEEIDNLLTKQREVVHSYGWYLRKFIADTRARGATPIVASPVPRNIWEEGTVARARKDYGGWARAVAEAERVAFLDLNEIIARSYEELGPDRVKSFFDRDHTHTNLAGAELSARLVVAGLKGLPGNPLAPYFSTAASAVASMSPPK